MSFDIINFFKRKYVIGRSIKPSDIYSISIGSSDGMTYTSQWRYHAYCSRLNTDTYVEYTHYVKEKNDVITEKIDIPRQAYIGILEVIEGCRLVPDPRPNPHVLDAPGFCGVRIGCTKGIGSDYHLERTKNDTSINSEVIAAIKRAAGIQ